ncbi:hypothetical protein BGX26_000543 [Mortierella sp. AD094]|nr:hypothetical protein BGX26_000543 [Mortierella sp. AD094]
MERWMLKADAHKMVNEDYGALFNALFIGNPQDVANKPGIRQTSYGRRTTTMREVSAGHEEFQVARLRAHVSQLFSYRSELAKYKESPDLTGGVPPERPMIPSSDTLQKRYVNSNVLRTDVEYGGKTIPEDGINDKVVVGIDPGEVANITTPLMERLKQIRPTKKVTNGQGVVVEVEIPSINELQTSIIAKNLGDSAVEAKETLERLCAFRLIDQAAGAHKKSERPALFVYGDGRFNTKTKLSSLHESFKGFFYKK